MTNKIALQIGDKSPQEFAVSEEHQMLCSKIEKMKFESIKETFK